MTDPITIIGSDTVVSGNLEGDEDLTIEGRVEGSITLSKTLTIEVGGVVRANIHVRNAIISGVLVGNIEAQDSVHLTEQGRVVGDISAPRVILVDGASFRGNIDMGEFDVGQSPRQTNQRSAPAPKRAAAPATVEESDDDDEASSPTRVRRAVPAPAPARPMASPAPRPAAPVHAPAPRPAAPAHAPSTVAHAPSTTAHTPPSSSATAHSPAPAPAASSSTSSNAGTSVSRPLPQKVLSQKIPPAPKVRTVGKVKAKKKD